MSSWGIVISGCVVMGGGGGITGAAGMVEVDERRDGG